jgi:DNA polymerase-3 subunit epsilon
MTKLAQVKVLVFDCQASSPDPEKGFLLEMGWAAAEGSGEGPVPEEIQVHLVRVPEEAEIPRQVLKVTGIVGEELRKARPPEEIYRELLQEAEKTARASGLVNCPTVIHYGRFEEPFLRRLHRLSGSPGPLPFEIICTHEIARRLMPDLPRRGLRALAGFFGFPAGHHRRSGLHVEATAFIWRHLVPMLEDRHVTTLDELSAWLSSTPAATTGERAFPMEKEIVQGLPRGPGLYRMLRAGGDVLYVGKAASLRQRVGSYFGKKAPHPEHKLEMLTQARDVSFTETGSALEASLLESDEIKRLCPPYNVHLQSAGRRLFFLTADFSDSLEKRTDRCSLGPVPSRDIFEAFHRIGCFLDREPAPGPDMNNCAAALGLPEEYAPDPAIFLEGLEVFRGEHAAALEGKETVPALKALGVTLWLKKLDEAAAEVPEDEPGEEEEKPEFVWTPEAVSRSVEGILRHSMRLVRRGRLLCLLSESSLAWESKDPGSRMRNLLVFRKGAIARRGWLEPGEEIPRPPGRRKSHKARQKDLDLPAYDRMRVLSTEIRRLVNEGRPVELRPSGGPPLGNVRLALLLRWV